MIQWVDMYLMSKSLLVNKEEAFTIARNLKEIGKARIFKYEGLYSLRYTLEKLLTLLLMKDGTKSIGS